MTDFLLEIDLNAESGSEVKLADVTGTNDWTSAILVSQNDNNASISELLPGVELPKSEITSPLTNGLYLVFVLDGKVVGYALDPREVLRLDRGEPIAPDQLLLVGAEGLEPAR